MANVHVVPKEDAWTVEIEGQGDSVVHRTESEAMENARRLAQQQKGELLVYGSDGEIRERDGYGEYPVDPMD